MRDRAVVLRPAGRGSAPRWLSCRLAVLVTLVLWLPDVCILYRGEPGNAVAVLMLMHLAIALVTCNLLVRLAPVRPGRRGSPGPPPRRNRNTADPLKPPAVSRACRSP